MVVQKKFYRKVLNNGMTIVFEKREIPVVSIAFALRRGGINESLEEKGIFHFMEHMLYKGTEKRDSRKIAEEIEKNGGILNGFTGEEITAYWCKMPSKRFNVGLDVLSDMIKNPVFDETELAKERRVIFEEIKMRKDNPAIYVLDEMNGFLYGGSLGQNLIGTEKTMNSIDREKMLDRFRQVYGPENLILCVVGDADFEEIVGFAEDNFAAGGNEREKEDVAVEFKNESETEKRKGIDQAHMVFAYHVPKANEKGSYVARVLSALTSEGMSSRLFHEIREKRNLAYSVRGDAEISNKFSHNFIYVGTMKENVGKVRELILEEFGKISENMEEKELEQVREQIVGNHQISMEDSQNQMVNLLYHELCGNAEDFYDFERKISEVGLEEVKELAKKAVENHSFFVLEPE